MPLRSELSVKRSHPSAAPLDRSSLVSVNGRLDRRCLERVMSCACDIAELAVGVGRESSSRVEAGTLSRAEAIVGVMRRRTILDRDKH